LSQACSIPVRNSLSHVPSPEIDSDNSAPAGLAPFAARSERLTATSFHPTLAGGSLERKCTPSAMLSWVITRPSRKATSSRRPRASGAVAIRRSRSMMSRSRISGARRPGLFGDRVQEAVHKAALALVVEGVGDVDIFGNDRGYRHVWPRDQFVGAGAENRAHRPVEPLESPALRQSAADQPVDLAAPGVDAGHHVIEEVAFGVMIGLVLDRRAEPMLVKFVEEPRHRSPFHLLLVERLDGGEPCGGARDRTGSGHAVRAVASEVATRKGRSNGVVRRFAAP